MSSILQPKMKLKERTVLIWSITNLVLCGILGVAMIYSATRFFSHSRQIYFAKRASLLTLFVVVCAMAHVIIFAPIYTIQAILNDRKLFPVYTSVFLGLTVHGLILINMIKFWKCYYSFNHANSFQNDKWRSLINPKEVDWYLGHRNTLGSARWLSKVGLVYVFVLTTTLVVLELALPTNQIPWITINTLSFLTMLLFSAYLYKRVAWDTAFDDIFHIRAECTLLFLAGVICFLFYLVSAFVLFDATGGSNHQHLPFQALFSIIFESVVFFISTEYVIYHNRGFLNRGMSRHLSMMLLRNLDRPADEQVDMSEVRLNYVSEMQKVLESTTAFDKFMSHLLTEFSSENLLFLVECMQFKHTFHDMPPPLEFNPSSSIRSGSATPRATFGFSLSGHSTSELLRGESESRKNLKPNPYLRPEEYGEDKQKYWAIFPMSLPKSPVHDMEEAIERVQYIYDKYCQDDAIHCINISFDARMQLGFFMVEHAQDTGLQTSKIFHDAAKAKMQHRESIPKDEIEFVFDKACIEIHRLLMDSFSRFACSGEYEALKSELAVTND